MFHTHCRHYLGKWLFPVHPIYQTAVACRLCYQENILSRDKEFDRHGVKRMVCAFCACSQPCADACANTDCTVHHKRHSYYCGICHLWMADKTKDVFHCDDCGICRIGRREEYAHCEKCNLCIQKDIDHKCWGTLDGEKCPVCYEACESRGREQLAFRPCGHAMHFRCFLELINHGMYRCPVCNM